MSAESALKQSTGLNGFCDEGQTNRSTTRPWLILPILTHHSHPYKHSSTVHGGHNVVGILISVVMNALIQALTSMKKLCRIRCQLFETPPLSKLTSAAATSGHFKQSKFWEIAHIFMVYPGRTSAWSIQAAHPRGLPRPHILLLYQGRHSSSNT